MNLERRVGAIAFMSLLASGCSGVDGEGMEYEPTEEIKQDIYGTGSVNEGTFGAVGLTITRLPDANGNTQGNCSGVLVNNYVILTAAHCLQPANADGTRTPAGNGLHQTTITYDAPDGTGFGTTSRNLFFYQHTLYDGQGAVRYDIAVGATNSSLGLGSKHFATLRNGTSNTNELLIMAGYGRPTVGSPVRAHVRPSQMFTGRISWASDKAWQGVCSGDSGMMLAKASGQSASGHEKWWAVSNLMTGVSLTNPLPGQPTGVTCNNNGGAVDVVEHHDWIEDIVEWWPTPGVHHCSNWTNGYNDSVKWCWDT